METTRMTQPREPDNKEHFRYLAISGRWKCERCLGNDMTSFNAWEHEQTRKHTRAVERYIEEKRRSTISAIQSQPDGVVLGPQQSYLPRDRTPIGRSLSSEIVREHEEDIEMEYAYSAPHDQDLISSAVDVPDTLRAAISRTMLLHSTHQIREDSDESDSAGGDAESGVIAPTDGEHASSTPYLHIGSQQQAHHRELVSGGPWYPWPDALACTLDVANNLQRAAKSDGDMELMLWLLQMNGVSGVPSLDQMKADQRFMDTVSGVEVKAFTGSFGHTYYMIPPKEHIRMDFADPTIRKHLQTYPEDAGCALHECSQADRWLKEADPHLLTPMIRRGSKDFYIYEPTILRDQTLCIPTRWYRKHGDTRKWAKAWTMSRHNNDGWVIDEWSERTLSEDELLVCGADVVQGVVPFGLPKGSNIYGSRKAITSSIIAWPYPMLNKWRTKAQGHRCESYHALRPASGCPLRNKCQLVVYLGRSVGERWAYCDDTSGNRSKKWNEHNSFLMVAAGLPGEHAHKEGSVHFLCTSNTAPPLEMLEGVVDEFEEYQRDGIWVYDCKYREMVLVIPSVLALLGDNPMQSEFACHAGLKAKFFCRICDTKGKDADDDDNPHPEEGGQRKETPLLLMDRVKRFIKIGSPRTREATQSTSRAMLRSVLAGEPQQVNKDRRTRTGVKDTFLHFFLEKARKKSEKAITDDAAHAAVRKVFDEAPKQPFSPVWRLKDLDPHAHTPIEILHVVLLGFLKYFWRDAISRLSDEEKETVTHRLSTMDVHGLDPKVTALRGRTLVKYCGSLVGRDFRVVAQTAIFTLYDMLPEVILSAWAALCKFIPLLWQPGTERKEEYLGQVLKAIEYFLICAMRWSPRWANKPKFHLLLHIVEHIRQFGPPILFATEVFESFNAVIRAWSVNSNGLAPSRDIAHAAASACRVAHLLRGGYFCAPTDEQIGPLSTGWTQAGQAVDDISKIPSVVTRRLGLQSDRSQPRVVGACHYDHAATAETWAETQAARFNQVPEQHLQDYVYLCEDVIIANQDLVSPGNFAVLHLAPDRYIVKVVEIIAPDHDSEDRNPRASSVLVQLCESSGSAPPYDMPRLKLLRRHALVPPNKLACAVNVQHNCAANSCDLGNTRPVYLEHERTTITLPALRHFNTDDLVLNTAKMRDAEHVQVFAVPVPQISSEDRDRILREAVEEEVDTPTV